MIPFLLFVKLNNIPRNYLLLDPDVRGLTILKYIIVVYLLGHDIISFGITVSLSGKNKSGGGKTKPLDKKYQSRKQSPLICQ